MSNPQAGTPERSRSTTAPSTPTPTAKPITDREAAAKLAQLLSAFIAGRVDRDRFADQLQRASAALRTPKTLKLVPEITESQERRDAADRIWQAWCAAMGVSGKRARFLDERRNKVLQRLRKYTEQEVLRAIAGCAASDHHMGKNDSKTTYNDLTLICRSDAKLEFFIKIADERGAAPIAVRDKRVEKLERDAVRALQEKRIDDYERINAELAELSRGLPRDGAATS